MVKGTSADTDCTSDPCYLSIFMASGSGYSAQLQTPSTMKLASKEKRKGKKKETKGKC